MLCNAESALHLTVVIFNSNSERKFIGARRFSAVGTVQSDCLEYAVYLANWLTSQLNEQFYNIGAWLTYIFPHILEN